MAQPRPLAPRNTSSSIIQQSPNPSSHVSTATIHLPPRHRSRHRPQGAAWVAKTLSSSPAAILPHNQLSQKRRHGRGIEFVIEVVGSKAIAVKVDVSQPAGIVSLFEKTVKHCGHLDTVVSNFRCAAFGRISEVTPEESERLFTVDTRGWLLVA